MATYAIYSTGNNSQGQLGLGDARRRYSFTEAMVIGRYGYPACGYNHSVVYVNISSTEEGIYTAGNNDCGQLGLGDKVPRNTFNLVPIEGIGNLGYYSTTTGNRLTGIVLKDGFGGWYGTDYYYYVCGNNLNNQFGGLTPDATKLSVINLSRKMMYLDFGDNFGFNYTDTYFLREDCWPNYLFGGNDLGQLGDDDTEDHQATIIGVDRNVPIYNGTMLNEFGGETFNSSVISNVSCGYKHTGIVLGRYTSSPTTYKLLMTGDNTYGQLGLGDYNNRNIFTEVDLSFSGATNISKISVVCFGSFTILHIFDAYQQINALYGCGRNDHFQLGLGHNNPVNTFTMIGIKWDDWDGLYSYGFPLVDVCGSSEASHFMAFKYNGKLYGWGRNHDGQLGMGLAPYITTPTLVPGDTGFFEQVALGCDEAGQSFTLAYGRHGYVPDPVVPPTPSPAVESLRWDPANTYKIVPNDPVTHTLVVTGGTLPMSWTITGSAFVLGSSTTRSNTITVGTGHKDTVEEVWVTDALGVAIDAMVLCCEDGL